MKEKIDPKMADNFKKEFSTFMRNKKSGGQSEQGGIFEGMEEKQWKAGTEYNESFQGNDFGRGKKFFTSAQQFITEMKSFQMLMKPFMQLFKAFDSAILAEFSEELQVYMTTIVNEDTINGIREQVKRFKEMMDLFYKIQGLGADTGENAGGGQGWNWGEWSLPQPNLGRPAGAGSGSGRPSAGGIPTISLLPNNVLRRR